MKERTYTEFFIYIKSMKRFEYASDVVKLGSFSDITSSRFKNKVQTMCLGGGQIEKKRVAVVKFRVNKRGGYGTRCEG